MVILQPTPMSKKVINKIRLKVLKTILKRLYRLSFNNSWLHAFTLLHVTCTQYMAFVLVALSQKISHHLTNIVLVNSGPHFTIL